MTIKRSEQTKGQIDTARQMPSSAGAGTDNGGDEKDDSQECKTAMAPASAHPGAPSKLPGYGK